MGVDRPLEFMLEESIAKGKYENNRQNRQKKYVKKAERGVPDFSVLTIKSGDTISVMHFYIWRMWEN